MAIKPDIEKYLSLPYRFDHGPTNRPAFLTDGVNCQLLAHLVVAHFGIYLHPSYRSREIYQSERSLNIVSGEAVAGDIFLFGRRAEENPTRLHLAVMVDKTSDNHPVLIHSTVVENKVALWSLAQFQSEKRYQTLFGIKRFGGENASHYH